MAKDIDNKSSDIVMYQTEDGATKVEVVFGGDAVWLTQEQIVELFLKSNLLLMNISKIFLPRKNLLQAKL